jgi:hypothetical protein
MKYENPVPEWKCVFRNTRQKPAYPEGIEGVPGSTPSTVKRIIAFEAVQLYPYSGVGGDAVPEKLVSLLPASAPVRCNVLRRPKGRKASLPDGLFTYEMDAVHL